ncbi:MAG: nitronate monooxygenase, partial [Solirubrobacteraceae bacterium]
MISTSFTSAFGIDAPVVQAPVASTPELVAAVSNAGGLGLLPITWLDVPGIRAAVRATRGLT